MKKLLRSFLLTAIVAAALQAPALASRGQGVCANPSDPDDTFRQQQLNQCQRSGGLLQTINLELCCYKKPSKNTKTVVEWQGKKCRKVFYPQPALRCQL